MSQEVYIGDGVYVTVGHDIKLRTERGHDRDPVNDVIYLEFGAFLDLIRIVCDKERCRITAGPGEEASMTALRVYPQGL
jgi:hypothetical protein